MVLSIRAGLDDIARASIIGSVIGNILLILGLSLIVGGWKNGAQTFNERVAATNSSMLFLGVAALGLPTLFGALEHDQPAAELLSRWTGGAMIVCYAAYLVLQLPDAGSGVRGRAPQAALVAPPGDRRAGADRARHGHRVGGAGRLDPARRRSRSACRGPSSA